MVKVTVRMCLESGDRVDIEAKHADGGEAFAQAMEAYWEGLAMMARSADEDSEEMAMARARKESAN